jgi:hypothetical protein
MRSIAKGSDGWYFENVKIEPTEEEIAAWEAIWCRHCSMGSIMAQHRLHKIARVGSLGSSSTTNSVRQRQHHVDHAPPVE